MAVNEDKFLKSLVYRRKGTTSAILGAVNVFRELDKRHESKAKFWGLSALVAFLVGGALFILAVMMADQHGFATLPGVLSIVMAIVCVVFIVLWRHHKGFDTEDRRYELLGQLLKLLRTDMAPDALVRVRLDLNKPNQRSKFLRKGMAGTWNVNYYKDDWLTLEGRFLDGTAFIVSVTELFQARSRWQRSASGKRKHKTKTKTATEFTVRLRPKAKRYAYLGELGRNAMGVVQLPSHAAPKGLTVADGNLQLKTKCKREWTATSKGNDGDAAGSRMVAMMFLSLYQVLNLSRKMTRKAG